MDKKNHKRLESEDLSIVIQGNITSSTPKLLKSIRLHFPNSEIILSTWEKEKYKSLDYDILVLSKDPGGVIFDLKTYKTNSLNRIIISSKNGVSKASKKYTLIIRSDMLVVNDNVLNIIDNENYVRKKSISLFKERIYSYELFSMMYEEKHKKRYVTPFHVSDWVRLGLTEDIKKLFDISTVEEPMFSKYFFYKSIKSDDLWPERLWKMSPEQYIISENVKKIVPNYSFEDRLDITDKVINVSNNFIVNNFIFKSIKEWGIVISKKNYRKKSVFSFSATASGAWIGDNWIQCYIKYCDHSFKSPTRFRTFQNHNYIKIKEKLLKILLPIYKTVRWCESILELLYYILKFVYINVYFLRKRS